MQGQCHPPHGREGDELLCCGHACAYADLTASTTKLFCQSLALLTRTCLMRLVLLSLSLAFVQLMHSPQQCTHVAGIPQASLCLQYMQTSSSFNPGLSPGSLCYATTQVGLFLHDNEAQADCLHRTPHGLLVPNVYRSGHDKHKLLHILRSMLTAVRWRVGAVSCTGHASVAAQTWFDIESAYVWSVSNIKYVLHVVVVSLCCCQQVF